MPNNLSSRQFGVSSTPAPMPSTIGSFGSGSMGTRPAPMPTSIGKIGSSFGSSNRPVQMPTRIFGR